MQHEFLNRVRCHCHLGIAHWRRLNHVRYTSAERRHICTTMGHSCSLRAVDQHEKASTHAPVKGTSS